MPPLNLDVTILGRPVKPVSFGLAVLMVTLFVTNILDVGVTRESGWGDLLGVVALLSAISLALAWIRSSQRLTEIGLLLATAAYTIRSIFLLLTLGVSASTFWYSLGLAVIAGGSFFLEQSDHVHGGTGGR